MQWPFPFRFPSIKALHGQRGLLNGLNVPLACMHSLPYPCNPQTQNNSENTMRIKFDVSFVVWTKISNPSKKTFPTENLVHLLTLIHTHVTRGCGMIDATNSILLLPGRLACPLEGFPTVCV